MALEKILERLELLEEKKERKDQQIAWLNNQIEELEKDLKGFNNIMKHQELKNKLKYALQDTTFLSCEINGLNYALNCIYKERGII